MYVCHVHMSFCTHENALTAAAFVRNVLILMCSGINSQKQIRVHLIILFFIKLVKHYNGVPRTQNPGEF